MVQTVLPSARLRARLGVEGTDIDTAALDVLATLEDEINELPMTVHTPLSGADGGLSGGQVQRLLLARAVYRRPCILFLDEATSQLDHATERRVIANLGTLGVTTISVAHRSNVLAAASRFIDLENADAVAFAT